MLITRLDIVLQLAGVAVAGGPLVATKVAIHWREGMRRRRRRVKEVDAKLMLPRNLFGSSKLNIWVRLQPEI